MWIQLGLAGGVVLLAVTYFTRTWRARKNRPIDVGPVSEAWLAEQRARGRETQY